MLTRLFYFGILIPLSWLPMRILYVKADFLYLILYRLVGYRKKVVSSNIEKAFPEKTPDERKQIEGKFYRHLCDLVVESIKMFTISEREALKRVTNKNPELINQYFEQGKSVVMVGGHYGNWELYALTIHHYIHHQAVALYTPIKNKFLDQKIRSSRGRLGTLMLSTTEIKRRMAANPNELVAIIFAADQSPKSPKHAHWMEFLNQDTGVQIGTEKFARDHDMPVIAGHIMKLKRGHYQVEYELITEKPRETKPGEISEAHTRYLERIIREKPEFWLWSHRRWKRKRPT